MLIKTNVEIDLNLYFSINWIKTEHWGLEKHAEFFIFESLLNLNLGIILF